MSAGASANNPPTKRTRKDPRKERAVESILEATEKLVGIHGVDGVTFKQITSTIGASNRYFAQYHVGDMDSIVKAILTKRLAQLEIRREEMLRKLKTDQDTLDTRTLLEILIRPISEIVNKDGLRVFAAFICGLYLSDKMILRYDFDRSAPVSAKVMNLLKLSLPPQLQPRFEARSMAVSLMMITILARRSPRLSVKDDEFLLQELLDMAVAALHA